MKTNDDVAFTLHKSKELVSHYTVLTANFQVVNARLLNPRQGGIIADLKDIGNVGRC